MRRLWTLALLVGALTATAETNYVWIPYLHPGATQWWPNIYALPDEVMNWQGWQAVDENFRRASNRFVAVQAQIDAGGGGAAYWRDLGEIDYSSRGGIYTTNEPVVVGDYGGYNYITLSGANGSIDAKHISAQLISLANAGGPGFGWIDIRGGITNWNGGQPVLVNGDLAVNGTAMVSNALSVGKSGLWITNGASGAIFSQSGTNVLRFQTNSVTALVPIYGDGVGLTNVPSSSISGLADAQTNAMLMSAKWAAASTNWIYVTGATTNIMAWTLTNFAGVTFSCTSGVPTVLWSTDSGTNWASGAENLITNVPVKLAFFAGGAWGNTNPPTALNSDIGLTNVVAYSLTRPDLFGRTNGALGQRTMVGTPLYPDDAASKSYVDAFYSSSQWWSAGNEVQLNNYGLNLDSSWRLQSVATNSALSASFLGQSSWRVTYPTPVAVTNLITATVAQRTNVTVRVPTNGLAVAPTLKLSHYLVPLNWSYMSTTPTNSGTNWVFSFVTPYVDSAFVAAVVPSANPGVFSMAAVLQLTPRTVTNASDSTWGNGSGLVCCDSNYVYVSVGSNVWKRVALSSW